MSLSLPLKRIHHIEVIAGNALQSSYFYRKAFGFDLAAYLGPETGRRGEVSYALKQENINLVVTSPLSHDDPRNIFLTLHGDSVRDICFEVDDVDGVFEAVVSRGAVPVHEPVDDEDKNGRIRKAAIRTYGDTIHTFLSRQNYNGPFLPALAVVLTCCRILSVAGL